MITSFTRCLFLCVVLSIFSLPVAVFGDTTPNGVEPAPGSEVEEPAPPPEAEELASPADALLKADATFEKGLTLQECIQEALRNNLGLRSASYTPRIAGTAIIEAKANFDAVYSLNYSFMDQDFPAATQLDAGGKLVLKQKSHDIATKIAQNLLTGGSIEVGFHTNHLNSNSDFAIMNPRSDSDFHFTIVQNLLRGFGPAYNRAPINQAENQKKVEDLRFSSAVLEVVYYVEKAYWDYVGYVHDLRVRDEAIKVSAQTVSDVEKRVKAGKMFEVDLLEAQEDLANQKLARLETAKQVADAREALIRLIVPYSDKVRWDMEIYVPAYLIQRQFEMDLGKHMHNAMENRPELMQAQAIIDNLKIDELVSKNEMRPTLNVGYGLTWHGLDSQTYDSVKNVSIDRFIDDQISAYFEYPLFNRAAKSKYMRARYNLDRAFIDVDSLRMDIVQDVRSAARNVEVTKSAIGAAQLSFELAVKKLEAEERRLEQGRSTLKDVLEFRRGKIRSETLRNRAKIGYEQSIDQLERATATSLAKYDIDILRDQLADTNFPAVHEDGTDTVAEKNKDLPNGAK